MKLAISSICACVCAFVSYLCCYFGIVELYVRVDDLSETQINKLIDYFGVNGEFSSYSILIYVFLTISLLLGIALTVLAFVKHFQARPKGNKALMTLSILFLVFTFLSFVFTLVFRIRNDEFYDYYRDYDSGYWISMRRTQLPPFHVLFAFTIASMSLSLLSLLMLVVPIAINKRVETTQNNKDMHANYKEIENQGGDEEKDELKDLTRLEDLYAFYKKGVIDEEEYMTLKTGILNRLKG